MRECECLSVCMSDVSCAWEEDSLGFSPLVPPLHVHSQAEFLESIEDERQRVIHVPARSVYESTVVGTVSGTT